MDIVKKFGGDPKQMKILGGLFAVLVVIVYMNYFSGPDAAPTPSTRRSPNTVIPTANAPSVARKPDEKRRLQMDRRAQEFRPRVGPARPEDRPDPMTVDPTLRLDQLARLERVHISGGTRSLFDFSNVSSSGATVARIIPVPRMKPPVAFIGPMQKPPDPPPVVAVKPMAPPIPLKFYGFTTAQRGANKRGFFLDGDEILVASEGELLKKRYKVIRIGLANVTMEDTQFQQQQTLPIVPDNSGGGQ